jgi:hypothetical protein
MVATLNHEADGQRDLHKPERNALAQGMPKFIRRRPRCNPVIYLGAVSAALLFDAISSPVGQMVWNHLLARLDAIHSAALIGVAVAIASIPYLIIGVAISSFARSRGANRAARAKDKTALNPTQD